MTTTARPDRRKARTRNLLRDALIELIQEKGYDQISVQDITDRANVNRATFYLHYHDKDELLINSMTEVYDDLVARMQTNSDAPLYDENLTSEIETLNHVKDYYGFYRVMLGERGVPAFIAKMMDYLARVTVKLCEPVLRQNLTPRVPIEPVSYYYAGATLGLITWWVRNGMPYSVAEVAQMWRDLDTHGGLWAMGIEE